MIVDGLRVHIETCSLDALDSNGIDTLVTAMANAVSPGCAILTHEFKGAACRVAADATAFGLRRAHILIEVLTMFPEPDDNPSRNGMSHGPVRRAKRSRRRFRAVIPTCSGEMIRCAPQRATAAMPRG
jgi:hypothetical protein